MNDDNRSNAVPNLPNLGSHAPAGWANLIEEAIAILDRELPGWKLTQLKQKLGGLRIYYVPADEDADGASHRLHVRDAIGEIEARSYYICDVCGANAVVTTTKYLRRTRCREHQRAKDVDLPLMVREVQELNGFTTGVWVVETADSSHIWDLDDMTYTRRPGPSSGADGREFDGNAMPITRVDAWPKVGESFFVWFDDPDDPDRAEHYRTSSTVQNIRPAPAPDGASVR